MTGASDESNQRSERDQRDELGDEELEDDAAAAWPVKGPATPRQAILAIGFVFFLGVAVGFLLCSTF